MKEARKSKGDVKAAEAKADKFAKLAEEAAAAAEKYRKRALEVDRAYQSLFDTGKADEDDKVAAWGVGKRVNKSAAEAYRAIMKNADARAAKKEATKAKAAKASVDKDQAMLAEATQHTKETMAEMAGEAGLGIGRDRLASQHTDIPVQGQSPLSHSGLGGSKIH